MKPLLFVCTFVLAGLVFANEAVLIEAPTIVNQLNVIQRALDKVSSNIMACIASGHEYSDCLCNNREIVARFNTRVEALLKQNSELERQDLVRFKSADGAWVTQSLNGISKQARAGVPSCP